MTVIDKQNVVLVVLDTARANDVPPNDDETMPTLAEMARTGTAYTNAFASSPWSLPSHASLFTGAFPSTHGAHGDRTYLDGELDTLAETFSDAGYETVGISNNTWVTDEFGFDRGFESFYKGWQYLQSDTDIGSVVRAKHRTGKVRAAARHLFDGNPLVNAVNILHSEFVRSDDDGADRTTNRVESWLGTRSADRPFFLFVNYLEPHIEYRPPREYAEAFLPDGVSYEEALSIRQRPREYDIGEYELTDTELRALRGLYRGELRYVDDHLRRLRTALREAGEWDDTILVVVGDHGENVGEHGFLGHQYNVYDTLLHVPLVVTGGAFDDRVSNEDCLVQIPDVAPTLLDAVSIDAPRFRQQCDGRSFHPGEHVERRFVYAEYISPQPPVETLEERFGEIPDAVYGYYRTLWAIRSREYKLIRGSDGEEELYHVRTDPRERTDLSATDPERAAELGEELDRWLSSFEGEKRSGGVSVSETTRDRLVQLGYM